MKIPGYAIGILLGVFLKNNKNFKLSKAQTILGNIFASCCILTTCILTIWNVEFDPLSQAYFASAASVSYTLIFVWIIMLSKFGNESEFLLSRRKYCSLKNSLLLLSYFLFRFYFNVFGVEIFQADNKHSFWHLFSSIHCV